MLKLSLLVVLSATITSTGFGQADGARPARLPEKVLRRFDVNQNGVLEPQERRRAREAAANSRAYRNTTLTGRQLLQRFDADGNGKLNDQERRAMRRELARRDAENSGRRRPTGRPAVAERPPAELPTRSPRVDLTNLLSAFDSNRDGKLTGAERARAFEGYLAR